MGAAGCGSEEPGGLHFRFLGVNVFFWGGGILGFQTYLVCVDIMHTGSKTLSTSSALANPRTPTFVLFTLNLNHLYAFLFQVFVDFLWSTCTGKPQQYLQSVLNSAGKAPGEVIP